LPDNTLAHISVFACTLRTTRPPNLDALQRLWVSTASHYKNGASVDFVSRITLCAVSAPTALSPRLAP
jgi:hypothetical protein